ncbi:OXNAD1 isoform 7 [Pan troglodytes]|uniref:Oxidoreductase NAD binding domain containing 1 n=2 Tax=Homininae TaxID=207598 RepID=F8WB50_HUMAN|nr:oxidoreductase NAD binding domain containing 1 [Homo sapiens]PNI73575.1 OXNAD1 isoform 7 [Pan troglodytes]
MACAAVMIPGLLRCSVGAIRIEAASLRLTLSTLRHLTLTRLCQQLRCVELPVSHRQ